MIGLDLHEFGTSGVRDLGKSLGKAVCLGAAKYHNRSPPSSAGPESHKLGIFLKAGCALLHRNALYVWGSFPLTARHSSCSFTGLVSTRSYKSGLTALVDKSG